MQGDTWASSIASAQVDSFGKEMIENKSSFLFKYMGEVPVPLLGMVDDLLGITEVGFKTTQLNEFVNVKTAERDFQFGTEKCKFMQMPKKMPESFLTPELSVDSWPLKHKENYVMTKKRP